MIYYRRANDEHVSDFFPHQFIREYRRVYAAKFSIYPKSLIESYFKLENYGYRDKGYPLRCHNFTYLFISTCRIERETVHFNF